MFSARQLGERAWRISAALPARMDLYLSGVRIEPDRLSGTFDRIEIEWTADAADVALIRGDAVLRLRARAAFVHEERPRIYDDLPLETFGPRSQTFWKRVFLLVRLPGGRLLLNYIARRARA
jgi:hypothetical protein